MNKIPRPPELPGFSPYVMTGCGKMYGTVNFYWNVKLKQWKVFELFINMGKAGGCAHSNMEALGRVVTYVARTGEDLNNLAIQLGGIPCHEGIGKDNNVVAKSCSDAVSRLIKKALDLSQEELEARYGSFKEAVSYDPDNP